MCYSAMVKASIRSLGLEYNARVQEDAFEDLFEKRLKGSGAKIPMALEDQFKDPKSPQEKHIGELIEKYRELQIQELKESISVQEERLEKAVEKLKQKETKTALNDLRIAGEKIQKFKDRLGEFKNHSEEAYTRIFPHLYAPLLVMEKGELVIKPYRYHLRPKGEPESFDRKFDGTYNVRSDRLKDVFWWKSLYGKHHGVLVISKFYENVFVEEKNRVIEFTPDSGGDLLVPCLFDHNEEGEFPLDSFALITGEPNPEVLAAGHDRTPILLKPKHLISWLRTGDQELSTFDAILKDKEATHFVGRALAQGV